MMARPGSMTTLRRLVELDGRRLTGILRAPSTGFVLGTAMPVLLIGSGLIALGRVGVFATRGAADGLTMGLLVAGVVAFLAYGTLFGASDDLFLRRVGVDPAAHLGERGLRLMLVGAAIVAGVALPNVAGGGAVLDAVLIATPAAAIAAGAATLTYAWAARSSELGGGAFLSAGMRRFDPELARAAPLVYAPLLPFLAGSAAGAVTGAFPADRFLIAVVALALALAMVLAAPSIFVPAAGRFLPRVAEMSYVPLPDEGGVRFEVGRGLSALLPRRAAAVWVRDATVAGRRYGWASRVSWPVAGVALIALARWGDSSTTHVWVIAAVGLALLIQAAAIIALGRMERAGPGWIDRSAGVRSSERALGRWAWGWGLSLWLLVPVALAWHWWSGVGGAWIWPLAGAGTAAFATAAGLVGTRR